jgi:hypothetical protein
MLAHQVPRPVGRHVLLIADIWVGTGSGLDGRTVEDVRIYVLGTRAGLSRVIARGPDAGAVTCGTAQPGTAYQNLGLP